MVFTITREFFAKVGVAVAIAILSIVMFAQGQHYLARQFCSSLNFTTGFATFTGVICETHVEFPYGTKLKKRHTE